MRPRWVPSLKPRTKTKEKRFRRSLVRDVLVILLLASLFPVILIGTLNFFRAKDLLRKQTARQVQSITAHEVEQLNSMVDVRKSTIDRLVTDKSFTDHVFALVNNPPESDEYYSAQAALFQSPTEDFFDYLFLLQPDGSVLAASDEQWAAVNIGAAQPNSELIRGLIGTNQSVFAYSPFSGYENRMVLLTSRSFTDENKTTIATLIATSSPEIIPNIISSVRSFLPGAASYYFTSDNQMVGVMADNQLTIMPENPGVSSLLRPIIGSEHTLFQFSARSFNNIPVIAYAEWLPEYRLGVYMQVSEHSVFDLNSLFDPFNVALLGISLIITGSLIYFSSTRLVNPLIALSNTADLFSKGNWNERTPVQRSDEIGLLADSFNHMADQLSEMYRSLESVVEKRTRQMRTAAEVIQTAASTLITEDALGQVVELIGERFGLYHVGVYLLDETGERLVLKEASGEASAEIKQRGGLISMNEDTLVCWVARNAAAKVLPHVPKEGLYWPNTLLPDTQSEMAVPIIAGREVLGVIDVRSNLPEAFDEESVTIFQTLSGPMSGALQNSRLLQTRQVSYEETALLYRVMRQVVQARDEEEVVQTLAGTLVQLPMVSAVLSLEAERSKMLFVTDGKSGRIEKDLGKITVPTGNLASLLIETRLLLIEDIQAPSDYEVLLAFLRRRDCKSAALIPVFENARVSKVLILGSSEANPFTQINLQPFTSLADVIGATLEKQRILTTLRQRLSELQILANFSQAISAETNLNNLFRVLHEQVMQTMGPDLEFAVALYNEKENLIEFPYYYEEHTLRAIEPFKLGTGLTSILIETRQPLLLGDEQTVRAAGGMVTGRPARSWMGIPLIYQSSVVGAILMQDLNNENTFSQDDLNLFLTLASPIATAVRNTQLYTETQQALRAYDQEHFLINTLLDNMPEGISFKDPDGRYIRASESLARQYNTTANEMIGRTDYDLTDRETAERAFREEQQVMVADTAEIGLIQHRVLRLDQETWTHISRIPIHTHEGDLYGLLLIHRDVTELKQAEALAHRRAEQILTAAEIARDTTGTLEVKTLLQKSVNLIRERFGFYHASIFLIDPAEEYAVLRESTGEAGQHMMEAGHRLAVGSKSIVGQVCSSGVPLIVNNVTNDPNHLPNPLLPDTRSELAIPLKVGDRILGALDVQSTQMDAFIAEDVGVLQILADQLAVALVNGELFAKTQDLLGKHRLLRQVSIAASASTNLEDAMVNVVSGLRTALVSDRVTILMANEEGTLQVQASAGYEGTRHLELRLRPGEGITGQAAAEKRPIRVDDTLHDPRYINIDPDVRSELAIPILFAEELVGVLNLESTQPRAFDENDQEILGALGNNLGSVTANIRLINQVRQQVVRERQLYDITSKIRRSVDLDTILETSAKELANALGARRASIRVTAGSNNPLASEPYQSSGNGRKNGQEDKE